MLPEMKFAQNAERPTPGPLLAPRPASPSRVTDFGSGIALAVTPRALARDRRGPSLPVSSVNFQGSEIDLTIAGAKVPLKQLLSVQLDGGVQNAEAAHG